MATEESENWERSQLEKLAADSLVERRRARRWGILFKLLTFIYLSVFLLVMIASINGGETVAKAGPHTALVDLDGVIAKDKQASADNIVRGLRAAFKDENTKGVILRINSPGGSPVQSSYINSEIRRLREERPGIPLYAVVEDMCASGGYFVAAAADKIYVNEASIVGSIGVISSGFGFVGTMEKLGVERRLNTAGEHKGFLDPFSPLNKFDKAHLKKLLEEVHGQFIQVVKEGRGERLSDDPDLFTGLFWSGKDSIRLGLADAVGSTGEVARDVIGAKEIVDYTPREGVLERLANRLGAGAAQALAGQLGLTGPGLHLQ